MSNIENDVMDLIENTVEDIEKVTPSKGLTAWGAIGIATGVCVVFEIGKKAIKGFNDWRNERKAKKPKKVKKSKKVKEPEERSLEDIDDEIIECLEDLEESDE